MDDLIQRMRALEADHAPDGWPAVQMRDISALCAEVEARNEQVDKQRQQIIALMHEVGALRAGLRDALESPKALVTQNAKLVSEVEALRADDAATADRIAEAEAEVEALRTERDSLSDALASEQEYRDAALDELDALRAERDAAVAAERASHESALAVALADARMVERERLAKLCNDTANDYRAQLQKADDYLAARFAAYVTALDDMALAIRRGE